VVVDSLNGYLHAMPDERSLLAQLHELLTYLNQCGVLTFLVVSQAGAVGNGATPVSLSYLTDNVLLFRFFEAAGRVRRALSVLKKRTGAHENTIRELRFDPTGIQIGEPLTLFQGVLTGAPQFLGDPQTLLKPSTG
jgi:circadian clock protein KaiC